MKCLRSLQGSVTELEPSIFGRFASEWFPAMVDALIGGETDPRRDGIHYLLLDSCVMFLGWPSLFPVPPRGGAAASLMNYLVRVPPRLTWWKEFSPLYPIPKFQMQI